MPPCTSCSAPLPVDTSLCAYCGTRNDLDVLALRRFTEGWEASPRQCPDCTLSMETLRLGGDGSFAVERCPACFGLFFDPGELQAFLDAAVTPAFVVNYREIVNINRERGGQGRPVRYIKCPECGKLMNRVNFAATSGVVIDQCKAHGVWLDNGELIHLMEWKRAGGQLLAEQRMKDRREETAKAAAARAPLPLNLEEEPGDPALHDLLTSALRLLGRLFG